MGGGGGGVEGASWFGKRGKEEKWVHVLCKWTKNAFLLQVHGYTEQLFEQPIYRL